MKKPPYLNAENAAAFKARTVAEYYVHRPAYSAEVYETLLRLVLDSVPVVLDAGCGPGKIARGLVEQVQRVDAVDFSAEIF